MSGYNSERAISHVPVDKIRPSERARSLCEKTVDSLAESIKAIGLQTPISVWNDSDGRNERYVLVTGLHRLEACRRLGTGIIDAWIIDLDETERRLWEIAENLHRAELTAEERADHVNEWVKLTEKRQADGISAQLEPKLAKDGSLRGRPQSGINVAVRGLGITRAEAQRAVKIAQLTPEAKAEAGALGLDDNQSALLKAAKAPSKEAQIRSLRETAARKAAGRDSSTASKARIEAAISAVRQPLVSGARFEHAVAAFLRQEFSASVAAIIGFVDILLDDARKQGLEDFVSDLDRMRVAHVRSIIRDRCHDRLPWW